MPDLSIARRLPRAHLPHATSGGGSARPAWWPAWSVPAGLRTLRAVLVIPSLFALTFEGFDNLQMALFAAFGGFASLIPDRLAGWWLASVVSTAVVLLIPAPSPGDRLRAAAARSAHTLATHLEASARGTATAADTQACQEAKHQLMTAFASTPYRPVGLATADQGMASVVQLLEWCTALVADATDGHPNLDQAAQADRDLLAPTAVVLGQVGDLLAGTSQVQPDTDALDRQREAATAYHRSASGIAEDAEAGGDSVEIIARHAFH